jgi:hypothetical protein
VAVGVDAVAQGPAERRAVEPVNDLRSHSAICRFSFRNL